MRLRVTASAQFMASAYGCSGEHVRRRDRDTQLETRHPVSPLVHNLAVPANAQAASGRVRPAPFREQPVDSDLGRPGRATAHPRSRCFPEHGRDHDRRGGYRNKARCEGAFSRRAQYIPAAPKCAPVCADADLRRTGLAQSIRGIALRISCSHAGAMRRRPFLCARNRLAVVAVCNTTRYR